MTLGPDGKKRKSGGGGGPKKAASGGNGACVRACVRAWGDLLIGDLAVDSS